VPQPLTPALALDHVLEAAGERGREELASVPGAAEQLALALAASIKSGIGGLEQDVALQLEPGLDLSLVGAPVRTFHGDGDRASPPEVGAWLASRLPHGVLDLVPGAGHHLLFPRWRGILRALLRDTANP
jgi:pimeloyl-ACP methyl ester carboxylesterase